MKYFIDIWSNIKATLSKELTKDQAFDVIYKNPGIVVRSKDNEGNEFVMGCVDTKKLIR